MSKPLPRSRGRAAIARPARVAVAVSRYNDLVTDALLEGAAEAYAERCGNGSSVFFVPAPGAYELPVIIAELAATGRFDALVALGCIIRGETTHDQHLATAVTGALTRISLDYCLPIGLGVLTVNNERQARDRAGGKHGNKGAEAMHAALDTLAVVRAIRDGAGAGADGAAERRSTATPARRANRGRGNR